MLLLVIALISGAIGAAIAHGKNRSGIAWFIICALFPLIGILFVALASRRPPPTVQVVGAPSALAATLASPSPDALNRWRVLIEVDRDIASAAAEARALGGEYERLLAEKYATLNDKSYLASLLDVVKATAASDAEARALNPEMVVERGEINGRPFERLASGKYRCWAKSNGKPVLFKTREMVEAFLTKT